MKKPIPPLYRLTDDLTCACSNVHNVGGRPGQAGPPARCPRLQPGDRVIIAELDGPAVLTRLWLTFDWPGVEPYPDSMLRNRSVRMEITWDEAQTPAINVPVGDFFNHPLCYDLPFENAFFACPVGRSLLCFIPMPFRKRAQIRLVNEFDRPLTVFHDIRWVKGVDPDPDDGYLHAWFNRTPARAPGLRHDILPQVRGCGRYLGTHLGLITDPQNPLPWHGAQPLFFFDGDGDTPSIRGASLDDFGGASWAAEKKYVHRDSGLLLTRRFPEGGGHFGLYYYHRRDPLYFKTSCAVSIRPGITMPADKLLALRQDQPALAARLAWPWSSDGEIEAHLKAQPDEWFECGRMDDLTSVAFYYLDRPEGHHAVYAGPERCVPAWHWPAPDAWQLLGD